MVNWKKCTHENSHYVLCLFLFKVKYVQALWFCNFYYVVIWFFLFLQFYALSQELNLDMKVNLKVASLILLKCFHFLYLKYFTFVYSTEFVFFKYFFRRIMTIFNPNDVCATNAILIIKFELSWAGALQCSFLSIESNNMISVSIPINRSCVNRK